MLVLSRQRDETIMIGDEIEITVVDIRGDKVRLGITAPTSIAVHRKEVYEAIRRENEHAARLNGDIQQISRAVQPGSERAAARSRAAQLARPIRSTPTTAPPTVTPAVSKSDPIVPKQHTTKRTG